MRFLLPPSLYDPIVDHTVTGCTCQQLPWTSQLERSQDAQRSGSASRSGQSRCRRGDRAAEDNGPMQGVEDDDCFFFSFVVSVICFISVSRRDRQYAPFARRHPLIHHPIHGDGDGDRPRARAGTALLTALTIGAVLLFTPAVQRPVAHLEKIKSHSVRLKYILR